jgi:predicted DsbA family dithiol-disulfide isomerase
MNAVEARGGNATFELHLRRRPFFLYPGGHHAIRPWGDRLDAIYPGGRESIRRLGDRAGFSFNFNAPLSDTMDSHRLYVWAERQGVGKGEALAQAVGHQYFEKAQALSDRAMLCGCAAVVGLDAEAARQYLESDAGYDVVEQEVQDNLRLGIHSIPVFIFRSAGLEAVVHGSADVERFGQVLDETLAAAAAKGEEAPKQEL